MNTCKDVQDHESLGKWAFKVQGETTSYQKAKKKTENKLLLAKI